MHPRSIKITTPPICSPTSLAESSVTYVVTPSPTGTTGAQKYRIEERRRTLYVTTDLPVSQWDPNNVGKMFTLAGVPETQQISQANLRRSRSLQVQDITAETQANAQEEGTRRHSTRSERHLYIPSMKTPPNSPYRNSPRNKILFYHRHDPHYGFTNFSPHSLVYKGKSYPTNEHLFQSFKVKELACVSPSSS